MIEIDTTKKVVHNEFIKRLDENNIEYKNYTICYPDIAERVVLPLKNMTIVIDFSMQHPYITLVNITDVENNITEEGKRLARLYSIESKMKWGGGYDIKISIS